MSNLFAFGLSDLGPAVPKPAPMPRGVKLPLSVDLKRRGLLVAVLLLAIFASAYSVYIRAFAPEPRPASPLTANGPSGYVCPPGELGPDGKPMKGQQSPGPKLKPEIAK